MPVPLLRRSKYRRAGIIEKSPPVRFERLSAERLRARDLPGARDADSRRSRCWCDWNPAAVGQDEAADSESHNYSHGRFQFPRQPILSTGTGHTRGNLHSNLGFYMLSDKLVTVFRYLCGIIEALRL